MSGPDTKRKSRVRRFQVRLAWGAEFFHEKLLGLDFRISPSAFFQVPRQDPEDYVKAQSVPQDGPRALDLD